MPGSQMSSRTTSGDLWRRSLDALFATAGEQGLVAFVRQHAFQRAADLRLVIHDQNGLHVDWRAHCRLGHFLGHRQLYDKRGSRRESSLPRGWSHDDLR